MTAQLQAKKPSLPRYRCNSNTSAVEQVTTVVHALLQARWKRIYIDYSSTAVFIALLLAIVAVAAIRFGWLSLLPWIGPSIGPWIAPWMAILGLLSLALAGSTMIAYLQRPDELEVAIDADIKLNLKQRLSTAWEYISCDTQNHATSTAESNKDHDAQRAENTVQRLAMQAVRARLPARARTSQVFASGANASAMMTPVALIALILISVIDLNFADRTASADTDQMVISEGVRLRDYGKRMQARARQRDLPRSDQQSLRLQELGNRMQSGALSRNEALSRLRDLDDELDSARRDAYNQGDQTNVGSLSTQAMSEGTQTRGLSARDVLQNILDGRIRPSEAGSRMLGSDPSALSRLGISAAEMRDALDRFSSGDRQALEKMIDKMSRAEQAARDASELSKAREQVARARESLGDKNARASDDPTQTMSAAEDANDGTPSAMQSGASAAVDDAGERGSSMTGGNRDDPRDKRERRPSNRELGVDENAPQLKAELQIREGGVFVSEARILPRAT
ncbi:MAG: hypothetical protein ACI8W7_001446, partial [Gammaproteobacteria bacterium]